MRSAATTAHSRPASSFGTPVPGPPVGQVGSGAVDGLGDVAQVLLGVVDINDLDGAGKVLGGQVPDPRGAVADDDALGRRVETAPYCLAIGPLCEGGRLRVGVAAGRAFDRGVVADRPAVPHGAALCVAPFGRPHGGQLDLAGLGRAVGLLAAASFDLGWAHRHAGAVQPQVHRRRGRRGGLLGDRALVVGDVASERLGTALDLPGLDIHPGPGRSTTRSPWPKLPSAAVSPTSRMMAGDSELPCRPRAWSRGHTPLRQASQW